MNIIRFFVCLGFAACVAASVHAAVIEVTPGPVAPGTVTDNPDLQRQKALEKIRQKTQRIRQQDEDERRAKFLADYFRRKARERIFRSLPER